MSFINKFHVGKCIADVSIPCKSILHILQSTLPDKDLRQVMLKGLQSYNDNQNDFEIYDTICNEFIQLEAQSSMVPEQSGPFLKTLQNDSSSQTNVIDPDHPHCHDHGYAGNHIFSHVYPRTKAKDPARLIVNDNQSNYEKVFNIKDLVIKTFQYLDLQSLLQCSLVNIAWLYDSYNPVSLYHINTDEIEKMRQNNNHGKGRFSSMKELKHTRSINVKKWNTLNETTHKYFQQLTKLNNFRKITIDDSKSSEYGWEFEPKFEQCLTQLIVNNAQKMTHLWVNINEDGREDLIETILKLKFPNMKDLSICNAGYKYDKFVSAPRLNKLELINTFGTGISDMTHRSLVLLQFWQSLVEKNLFNLETLVLDSIFLISLDMDELQKDLFPTLVKKLINVKHMSFKLDHVWCHSQRLVNNSAHAQMPARWNRLDLPFNQQRVYHVLFNNVLLYFLFLLSKCGSKLETLYFEPSTSSWRHNDYCYNFSNLKCVEIRIQPSLTTEQFKTCLKVIETGNNHVVLGENCGTNKQQVKSEKLKQQSKIKALQISGTCNANDSIPILECVENIQFLNLEYLSICESVLPKLITFEQLISRMETLNQIYETIMSNSGRLYLDCVLKLVLSKHRQVSRLNRNYNGIYNSAASGLDIREWELWDDYKNSTSNEPSDLLVNKMNDILFKWYKTGTINAFLCFSGEPKLKQLESQGKLIQMFADHFKKHDKNVRICKQSTTRRSAPLHSLIDKPSIRFKSAKQQANGCGVFGDNECYVYVAPFIDMDHRIYGKISECNSLEIEISASR